MRIKDVAAMAGVSPATVSRVLNNNPQVNIEAREKVKKVIAEIGYTPNLVAQNLRKQNSNTVLLVVPDIINPVFSMITKTITEFFETQKINTILIISNGNEDSLQTIEPLLKSKVADGAIFVASSVSNNNYVKLSKSYPIVMCSEYFEDIDMEHISIDNITASYQLAKYLLNKGNRAIVYFHAKKLSTSSRQRIQGLKNVIENHPELGAKCFFEPIQYKDIRFYEQVKEYLHSNQVDAMMINSDIHTLYAIQAVKDLKNKVDIGSFDGTQYLDLCNYDIAYIKQPLQKIGICAAELLIKKICNEPYQKENIFEFLLSY